MEINKPDRPKPETTNYEKVDTSYKTVRPIKIVRTVWCPYLEKYCSSVTWKDCKEQHCVIVSHGPGRIMPLIPFPSSEHNTKEGLTESRTPTAKGEQ